MNVCFRVRSPVSSEEDCQGYVGKGDRRALEPLNLNVVSYPACLKVLALLPFIFVCHWAVYLFGIIEYELIGSIHFHQLATMYCQIMVNVFVVLYFKNKN